VKWNTHITVTRQVLEQVAQIYALPEEFVRAAVEACIEPDKVPDEKYDISLRGGGLSIRLRPVRHHSLSDTEELVDYYIRLSVYAFLRGRYSVAGRALGRAIHYVQDAVLVQVPHSLEHDYVEELVDTVIRSGVVVEDQPISTIVGLLYTRTQEVVTRFLDLVSRSRHVAATVREAKRSFLLDMIAALLTTLFLSALVAVLYVKIAGVVLGALLLLGLAGYGYIRYSRILDLETRHGLKRPRPPLLYKTVM
jgi:hypothetical protein